MQKSTFLTLSLALAGMTMMQDVSAQHYGVAPRFAEINGTAVEPTNYHKDYTSRFFINEPASVAGSKVFTIANGWGGTINSVWNNVSIVAGKDSLACNALTNASAINGNWALVYRGDCEFGRKAFMAQQAGAEGVIIVNNVSGSPVGMGAGAQGAQVTIPVLMISKEDGDAINAELNAGNTVRLSIAPWGFGVTNDLGFLSTGGALWSSYAIPKSQLVANNGNPEAYKAITGAFIGNFGSANQTNVVIKSSISFTPDGGSATVLKEDSIRIPTFNASDSIMYGFTDDLTDVHATGTGRIEAHYTLTADQTEDLPGDNVWSTTSYVTDSIYSKGRFDFELGEPVVGQGYAMLSSGGNVDFVWGPMYYVAKGGEALRTVQFSISNGDPNTPSMEHAGEVFVYVFEWNNTTDSSFVVGSDLTAVAVGNKRFVAGDSSGDVVSAYITDIDNPQKAFVLKDDTWYWVGVAVRAGWYLGVDGYVNYYPRTFFRRNNETAPYYEYYAPTLGSSVSDLANATLNPIPFDGYTNGDSARYSQQMNGLVPAVALHFSSDTTFVSVEKFADIYEGISLYPNPAVDVVNVQVDLVQTADQLSLTVFDVAGRVLANQSHANVKNGLYSFATNSMAAGTYYLYINPGGDGTATVRKFVVSR